VSGAGCVGRSASPRPRMLQAEFPQQEGPPQHRMPTQQCSRLLPPRRRRRAFGVRQEGSRRHKSSCTRCRHEFHVCGTWHVCGTKCHSRTSADFSGTCEVPLLQPPTGARKGLKWRLECHLPHFSGPPLASCQATLRVQLYCTRELEHDGGSSDEVARRAAGDEFTRLVGHGAFEDVHYAAARRRYYWALGGAARTHVGPLDRAAAVTTTCGPNGRVKRPPSQ
jgi:hypothetical protein